MKIDSLMLETNLKRTKQYSPHLSLGVVSSAAPGAVAGAGVGVIAGGGGRHCGGRVARGIRRVSVAVAGAGHGVHHIEQGQPEKQLQEH